MDAPVWVPNGSLHWPPRHVVGYVAWPSVQGEGLLWKLLNNNW